MANIYVTFHFSVKGLFEKNIILPLEMNNDMNDYIQRR
jgi:hypothetical protein